MSVLQSAKHVDISGGTQIAAGAGSSFTFNQGGQTGPSIALQNLSAAAAHTALHDSSARLNPPRCHRNTRTTYLDGLEHWMRGIASDYDDKRLIWLNGGAGAGKSAIMQSIVERCTQHAVILGAFFFSRTDPSRNNAAVLIPTLAYQLVRAFPTATAILESVIQHDPLIFKVSLRTQAYELLVRPLLYLVETGVIDSASPLRKVFVIDGLDECDNREEQAHIIQVVAAILCDFDLPVSFLIASRPETAISRAFHTENRVHSVLSSITLDNDADARSDIRQFIEDSFLDICDTHPQRKHLPPNWPPQTYIDGLVAKSSGHFIYAATAMKFISSSDELPDRALQVLKGLVPSRTGNPFSELDALYLHIITSAKHSSQVLDILRHCTLTHLHNTVDAVCFMYPHFSPQDVELFLSDVQALVSLSPGRQAKLYISLKHASLGDFFEDNSRSKEIYMSPGSYKASLLPRFFMLFDDSPQFIFPDSRSTSNVMDHLTDAIRHSQDIGLLRSLIRMYPPRQIWNFYWGPSGANDSIPAHPGLQRNRNDAIDAVSSYLTSIRNSIADHDGNLYIHHLKTFIPVLLEDLKKLIRTEPEYQIIPALIFSSGRCCLTTVAPALIHCLLDPFRSGYATFLRHMGHRDVDGNSFTELRAYETIRSFPGAQMLWGSNLANALGNALKGFLRDWWTPEFLAPYPHQKWLNRVKLLKRGSERSLEQIPADCLYCWEQWQQAIRRSHYDGTSARRHLPSLRVYKRWFRCRRLNRAYDTKGECVVLLRAIIHYLRKCDPTSALAKLVRKSLPKTALWFPRLMKKARREMDAYVDRWDESPEGLLERAQSLTINEMD